MKRLVVGGLQLAPKSRGAMYVIFGAPALAEAERSMASLWQYTDLPVVVVGDQEAVRHYQGNARVKVETPAVQPFHGTEFMAGTIKPLLAELSPFDETIYADADSEFASSPDSAFRLLERWDFVVAETETRSLETSVAGPREARWTAQWLGTPHIAYHNSGLFLWRKNVATDRLFELWSEEWRRFGGWDEQVALLRALLRSEAMFLTVPFTWNCRRAGPAVLLHHRFGTRTARAGARPGRSGFPSRGDMVTVEVAPGRFINCRRGQEEFMKWRIGRLHLSRDERKQIREGETK